MPKKRETVQFFGIYGGCKQIFQKGLIMMGGKIHLTKEEKFLESLKLRDENDNRPFIRINVDEARDKIVYEKKRQRITEEKLRISKVTGDPIENINLFDSMGHEYSRVGNIRDYEGSR